MANKKDNLFDLLKQIGEKQNAVIADIERHKEDADAETLEILEKIERDVYEVIIDVDSEQKKIDAVKTNQLNVKAFLSRGIKAAKVAARIERDPNFGIPL